MDLTKLRKFVFCYHLFCFHLSWCLFVSFCGETFLNPWLSLYFISFPKFMRLWQSLPPVGLLIELASFNYVSKKKISQHSMFLFSKSLGQLWAKFWKCLFVNCSHFIFWIQDLQLLTIWPRWTDFCDISCCSLDWEISGCIIPVKMRGLTWWQLCSGNSAGRKTKLII